MAKLTREEARVVAVHVAYLAQGLEQWLEQTPPEEAQRRLDFVVDLLTPAAHRAPLPRDFAAWYDRYFHGMPEMPVHIKESYHQAYQAGFAAGREGL